MPETKLHGTRIQNAPWPRGYWHNINIIMGANINRQVHVYGTGSAYGPMSLRDRDDSFNIADPGDRTADIDLWSGAPTLNGRDQAAAFVNQEIFLHAIASSIGAGPNGYIWSGNHGSPNFPAGYDKSRRFRISRADGAGNLFHAITRGDLTWLESKVTAASGIIGGPVEVDVLSPMALAGSAAEIREVLVSCEQSHQPDEQFEIWPGEIFPQAGAGIKVLDFNLSPQTNSARIAGVAGWISTGSTGGSRIFARQFGHPSAGGTVFVHGYRDRLN